MASVTVIILLFSCIVMVMAGTMEEPFDPGLKVGDRVPAFKAKDQHGQDRDFDSLTGAKGLVIIFHRSASW